MTRFTTLLAATAPALTSLGSASPSARADSTTIGALCLDDKSSEDAKTWLDSHRDGLS